MAYAPANAAATIATSSRTRSAVKTWWCRLNIARGSTGKGPLAQAPGHPPLWNPYLFCGCPLIADPQMQVCYPPALVFRVWPYAAALGGFLALHVALAVGGGWSFLRVQRIGRAGAALGAAAYGLSGQMFISSATPVCLTAMAWLPWVGWAAVRAARQPGGGTVLALAMILAWLGLAGHPQFIMYAAALMVFLWMTEGRSRAAAVWMAGAALLAFGVDAVQALPTLAYIPLTGRSIPLGEAAAAVDALRWDHLRS